MDEQTDNFKGNFVNRWYIDCTFLSLSIVGILNALVSLSVRPLVEILDADEQTDNFKGNQYTYDGRTDRQGQSIYL
jgi:hypothetical protein